MNFVIKIIILFALGIFIFYACGNKVKILKTPAEVADAIRKNDTNAISDWLKNGGDSNLNIEGSSPLYIATGPKGGQEVLTLLLENGASVGQEDGTYTPLMNAASWVNLAAVNMLLQKGADINLTNERGETAYDVIGDCGDCPEQSQLQEILKTAPTVTYAGRNGERIRVVTEANKVQVKVLSKNQPAVKFAATRVPSGSGEKFAGEDYTYWTEGNACFIEKDGAILFENFQQVKTFEGNFSYLADANMFVSCDKTLRLPVEMEGNYLELERAYLNLAVNGAKVYVRLKGYTTEVPAMEGGGKEEAMIVTQVLDIDERKQCADATSNLANNNAEFLEYTVDDAQAKAIAAKLKAGFLQDDFKIMEAAEKQFQFYKIDLNDDGKSEYLVRLMGSYFCGSGGCTFLLLGNDLEIINKFTVTRPPFFVSKVKKNGWRVIMVKSEGKFRELVYQNGKYPSNPTVVKPSKLFPSGHDEILFEEKKAGVLLGKTYSL